MDFVSEYAAVVTGVLDAVWTKERAVIERAGGILSDSLAADGMLYVFGCGHSHMVEEELFYREGGLGAVCPIFETSTMLHEGAAKSSRIERMSGYAELVAERYDMGKKDCLLAVSSSGINPFVIELAQIARAKGTKVLGISSFYYKEKPSRHREGLHLPDVCDVCIDNHVPTGDACVAVCSDGTKAGPVSSVASLAIADAIMLSACQKLRERGMEPEVFKSGNCAGGDEYNERLIGRFRGRVRSL